jgi:1,4-dihydroxy-2-naphthoate octaprenyltransferase
MRPFEIRDLESDEAYLSTIPQKIGIQNTKLIGCALLADSFILEFLKQQTNRGSSLVLVFTVAVLAVLLVKSTPRRNRYYSSFLVESVPIIALILTFFLN